MLSSLEIIDFHAHFPIGEGDWLKDTRRKYIERFGSEKWDLISARSYEAQEKWWDRWGFGRPETKERPLEELADMWRLELERYGVQKIVWVTAGGNQTLRRVVETNPDRFVGFAHHEPFAPNAVEELEQAVVEWGFKGYKILAPAVSGPLDDPRLDRLWAKAEELGIPVLVHFGILGGGGGIADHVNINPLILHDVAKGFPNLPFVIPHFGCGYVRELLHLCWVCDNVYVDTSGNNEWMRWMPEKWTLNDLFQRFYETIGPDRIIFGTDSSWFPRGFVKRYLDDQIRAVGELGWNIQDVQKVFAGNAKSLLKLS